MTLLPQPPNKARTGRVIFEPVVGDFHEHFSNPGFFDSLVSPPQIFRISMNNIADEIASQLQ